MIIREPQLLKIVQTIGRCADRQGLKVFLVGGVVRDILLQKKNLDLDIVVEGDALAFVRTLMKSLKGEIKIYPQFGTATLTLSYGRIDFSSARKEIYPEPGVLPRVERGTLYEDLFRRDFTINAIAISINADQFGTLVDPFQGLKDLKEGKIRILHEKSFIDDGTRILRAIRFEQRFGFKIERGTSQLLKRALATGLVLNVHPHRYFSEVRKMFKEPSPTQCFLRLKQLGGFKLIRPRLTIHFSLMRSVEKKIRQRSLKSHQKTILYVAALFKNVSVKNLPSLLKTFPFLKEEREALIQSRQWENIQRQLSRKILKPSDVYCLLKPFDDAVIIYGSLMTSNPVVLQRLNRFLSKDRFIQLELRGKDLEKMGFSQGKEMGEALKKILWKKLDGELRNKKEEFRFAKAMKPSIDRIKIVE